MQFLVCAALMQACPSVLADQDGAKKEESPLRFVPQLTSTPLTGTGLGVAVSYLYKIDEPSSMSQLEAGAQYSDTDSITTFVRNRAWIRGNNINSFSALLWSDINSEFDGEDGRQVEYAINSLSFTQRLLFRMRQNLYVGGSVTYKNIEYSPNNDAGEDFLFENGIVDEESFGIGVAASFDSRKNKYYPRDSYWVDIDVEAFPSAFGSEDSYELVTLNARAYWPGFNTGDVWANQLYGKFASERTPDSALPTLSGKSMLRGFPAGQYKARDLYGVQTEYRYQIVNRPYRLIAFAGIAELSGGSFGVDGRERDDDGTYWAVGVGGRYALQSRTGVDLRLDIVTTNDNEESVYLALNQAF